MKDCVRIHNYESISSIINWRTMATSMVNSHSDSGVSLVGFSMPCYGSLGTTFRSSFSSVASFSPFGASFSFMSSFSPFFSSTTNWRKMATSIGDSPKGRGVSSVIFCGHSKNCLVMCPSVTQLGQTSATSKFSLPS